jgi:hypothetical protein
MPSKAHDLLGLTVAVAGFFSRPFLVDDPGHRTLRLRKEIGPDAGRP